MFSTEYPYAYALNSYETDNVKIWSNKTDYESTDIRSFLMAPSGSKPKYGNYNNSSEGVFIQYDFKTPITPKQIKLAGTSSSAYWMKCNIYYLIDGAWVKQATTVSGKTFNETITLPKIKVSSIKVAIDEKERVGTGTAKTYFTDLVLYFELTSGMVKSKVTNAIMQNTFFQQMTSPVEILTD